MLFLQGSAGTRNKCGGQYLYHCVKKILGCNLSKMIKIGRHLTVISIYHDTSNTVQFLGHPVYSGLKPEKCQWEGALSQTVMIQSYWRTLRLLSFLMRMSCISVAYLLHTHVADFDISTTVN